MSIRLTDNQRRKIFGLARMLTLDDDLLHVVVYDETGQESIAKLTRKDAARVIARLAATLPPQSRKEWERRGGPEPSEPRRRKDPADKIIFMASEQEVNLAYAIMRNDLDWTDERIEGFVRHQTQGRKKRCESCTAEEINAVIEGAKSLARKKGTYAYDKAT